MSEATNYNKHEVEGTYLRQTERGVLLQVQGEEVWLPKSQIRKLTPETKCEEGDTTTIEVPEWLMKEKGLME